MRIVLVTDAWYPQTNGVVRVLASVKERLERRGHACSVIAPDLFRTIPCPTYPEIRLSLFARRRVAAMIESLAPEAVHIATEGPLGAAARGFCLAHGLPFTTAYHTRFPEYIRARTGLPLAWLYPIVRRFHGASRAVLAPSPSVFRDLAARGFANVKLWSHGVDIEVFKPGPKDLLDHPRPIHMYVGRVAVEKDLPAFLSLDLPGSKVVVGNGPARRALMRRYPDAHFHIARGDAELARYFNAADVFVFPSRTDTFGLVMLEALATGVPVAAFPVAGPTDVIGDSGAGVLCDDLRDAAGRALAIDPQRCRAHAARFSWERVVDEFLDYLAPIG